MIMVNPVLILHPNMCMSEGEVCTGVDAVLLPRPSKILLLHTSTYLQVYAPWCGHCKALEPVYKKLAKRFAKVDSVVIAKMDGTENEHADVEVKGFPTILFYPAGADSKPITFEGGDRSLKVGWLLGVFVALTGA